MTDKFKDQWKGVTLCATTSWWGQKTKKSNKEKINLQHKPNMVMQY